MLPNQIMPFEKLCQTDGILENVLPHFIRQHFREIAKLYMLILFADNFGTSRRRKEVYPSWAGFWLGPPFGRFGRLTAGRFGRLTAGKFRVSFFGFLMQKISPRADFLLLRSFFNLQISTKLFFITQYAQLHFFAYFFFADNVFKRFVIRDFNSVA